MDIENHMLSRDDVASIVELNSNLKNLNEKQMQIIVVARRVEDMILYSDKFSYDEPLLRNFFDYLTDLLDDLEQERQTLEVEISALEKRSATRLLHTDA